MHRAHSSIISNSQTTQAHRAPKNPMSAAANNPIAGTTFKDEAAPVKVSIGAPTPVPDGR